MRARLGLHGGAAAILRDGTLSTVDVPMGEEGDGLAAAVAVLMLAGTLAKLPTSK